MCAIAVCCRCVLLLCKLFACPIDPILKAQTLSCCAVLIFIVLLIFMFVTYTTSSKIGNIGVMYDNLVEVARVNPVSGNRGGSYLTFWSIDGLKFGVLQTVSCWGKLQSSVKFLSKHKCTASSLVFYKQSHARVSYISVVEFM